MHSSSTPHFLPILIVDNPLETKENLIETLLFLLTLKKPFLSKTFDLVHLPKTDLTEKLLNEGYITKEQIEGNKKEATYSNWRVDGEKIEQKQQKRIIALIQLTGNIFIPNWIIKILLQLENKIPAGLKNKIEKLTLNEHFYKISAIINAAAMQKKSVVMKKIIRKLYKKLNRTETNMR